jgi:hypothetical protein
MHFHVCYILLKWSYCISVSFLKNNFNFSFLTTFNFIVSYFFAYSLYILVYLDEVHIQSHLRGCWIGECICVCVCVPFSFSAFLLFSSFKFFSLFFLPLFSPFNPYHVPLLSSLSKISCFFCPLNHSSFHFFHFLFIFRFLFHFNFLNSFPCLLLLKDKESEVHRTIISNSGDVVVVIRDETGILTQICIAAISGHERRTNNTFTSTKI